MPVLDALSEVHYRNIVHRDIKPDNIIIMDNGSAKLIDFGAARYNQGEKSKSLMTVLTPGYAPLEQYFTRGRQGPWTDVYALAATIYLCITGKIPIDSVERSSEDTLKKPSELGVVIPDYAETALMKALAVKEKDRYESTYDFRNAVLEGKRLEEEDVTAPISIKKSRTVMETQRLDVDGNGAAQGNAGLPVKFNIAAAVITVLAVIVFAISNRSGSQFNGNGNGGNEQASAYSGEQQISRTSDDPMELTDTWEEIIAAGNDGTYKDRYRVGDTKELDMGSEGIITMKLVAMDEDELADGSGKAPMTWLADELLQSAHNMNSAGSHTNWHMIQKRRKRKRN